MLPLWLQTHITQMTAAYSSTQLAQAYTNLSNRYRLSADKRGFKSQAEAVAYVAARLPATYACVQSCLKELPEEYAPQIILDLGSGPGTATLACLERFKGSQYYLLEEDAHMTNIGQQLIPQGLWHQEDISSASKFPSADLVLLSYVLNELPSSKRLKIIDKIWNVTNDYLLIITAGTPQGFEQLREVRSSLIDQGASIIAPCPHSLSCPLQGQDWCHFRTRLPRSSLHRSVKGAELNYEDEKFSYLLASKHPNSQIYQRVLKQPQHRSSHGIIDLCTPQGTVVNESYSKSKSEKYALLRKSTWGDKIL
ncbi:small ribosomal subunit Rsm22 family protein [Candidatus Odyssella thessalonicensis]|uniref:small ribosomal subunit Rsm22 family protein n=1 Tax=Candidatus Odyssella thessalonicensis TaxID=84647 RepID=UPI000225C1F2|nr:small ribosomal subunit Rsm22 family protein [Candidatus Odyssella thessalonicensis]